MACLGSTVNVTGQHSRPRWGALGGAGGRNWDGGDGEENGGGGGDENGQILGSLTTRNLRQSLGFEWEDHSSV